MTNSQRQHGIGSLAPDEKIVGKPGGIVEAGVKQYGIFKKIKKGVKKVFKSKLGKAALIGGLGAFGLGALGGGTGFLGKFAPSAMRAGLGKIGGWGASRFLGSPIGKGPVPGQRVGGLWNWIKGNPGKAAMIGAGGLGMTLPFIGGGGGGDDDEEESNWLGVDAIRQMARDRHPSLAFMPPEASVQSGYYSPKQEGGIVGLANGGQPAEAQAEQMLKMEYQKYRNQGGTMSYQQFKMAVLQQAQGQGPMAQGQPQRGGYQGGELVEDASMIEETPTGLMEENVEEVQGEPTREQLEALAMEIFQLRLEELDEEQLMVVYQAAMEQQPEAMAMQEEDIQFNPQMGAPQMGAPQMAANGGLMGSHVPGYTTPPGYNRFDYPSGGVRVGRAEGGIMDLGGMEKDYRAEGGFVPIGGEEKADDVPARLSKNEFVFTADAVRNAGGGDIDAGAEVMQNMMDNLESGGQISEESQGGGGEEMISEEEMVEGPSGAQEMYDQQAMLESRMA